MRVLSFCETGFVRQNNEDGFLVLDEFGIYAVADGMGGHSDGEIASGMVLREIDRYAGDLPQVMDDDLQTWLTKILAAGNRAVFEYAQASPDKEMGTTLTVLLLRKAVAIIAHIGDSRAYLWRDRILTRLTVDHSLPGELVRHGKISQEEAAHHPMRHRLLRALGPFKEINPEYYNLDVLEGDVFLLCTDGVTNMLSEEELGDIFVMDQSWDDKMEQIRQLVLERGARDNFTALCCILD